ncbi:uracil-xanthine permease family protein [Mycoplasma sp. P36-A1]|uniref:uracil-xanthine permease family protein n=1 Tax=Mycoplasma sp. P36-A1 TaxID=3252900 RepID=UPI003C2B2735
MNNNKELLKIKINEKPKNIFLWILLSFQHVFAMFGATVLVPALTGLDPAVAIFCSGIGTLIYITCTKGKVPVYLGSSFAYISAISLSLQNGGYGAVASGLMVVGITYAIVSVILRFTGINWLKKLMPPIVVGPMIMVIGLGLASSAVTNAGLSADAFNAQSALIAAFTLLVTALVSIIGKGFFKIIPILIGIISGYLFALALGAVDLSSFNNISLFAAPPFQFAFIDYQFDWSVIPMFLPLALVTIAEHIGDHTVLSSICGKDFIKDPGLKQTLLGDGLASLVAGLIGGPANTTYGENTGVIAITKVGSVYVIGLAAIFAMCLSFLQPVAAFIYSIPAPVMGGISIMLFGIIASNGVKILIENKTNFNDSRNLVIAASMLILGIGGAAFNITSTLTISGMALAALVGMILNLVLPHNKDLEGREFDKLINEEDMNIDV